MLNNPTIAFYERDFELNFAAINKSRSEVVKICKIVVPYLLYCKIRYEQYTSNGIGTFILCVWPLGSIADPVLIRAEPDTNINI
jgi:hypothetical protein